MDRRFSTAVATLALMTCCGCLAARPPQGEAPRQNPHAVEGEQAKTADVATTARLEPQKGERGALQGFLCVIQDRTLNLKEVGSCKRIGVMYTNMLNITPRRFTHGFPGVAHRTQWFAIEYVGKFEVTKAGEHQFRVHSDDGSMLWIDGTLVVDNDGLHPPLSKTGRIHLEQGNHRIRLFYFQGSSAMIALQLFVTPPGGTEVLWGPRI